MKSKKSLTKLECFIYVLVRSYPGGNLEEALQKAEELADEPLFTDGWMVDVAKKIAKELNGQSKGS